MKRGTGLGYTLPLLHSITPDLDRVQTFADLTAPRCYDRVTISAPRSLPYSRSLAGHGVV